MWGFNLKGMFIYFHSEKMQLLKQLPRDVVESPSLKVFKMQLVRVLDNLT